MVEAFGPEGFRWIAGSRFGYLRAQLPPDASTAAQADALAALLDALGIERAAVLAMSGGVPPALQLARRHPGRVDRLVLLSSAPLTPLGAEAQRLPLPAWAYRALFVSDLPYWLMQRLGRGALGRIFDAPPERRAALDPGERGFLEATIDGFQPVTARRAGLANEGAAIDPAVDYGLAAIAAPALVVHAEDDGINPFPIGAWLADALPAATLRPLQDGGHLLLGHHSKVRRKVAAFLAEGR
jgi:pimeloyl-ACP methyl ester carboxylesterase